MKKILFGGVMILAGIISASIILTGSAIVGELFLQTWRITQPDVMYLLEPLWHITKYQLHVPLAISVVIAVIGFVLCILGLIDKKDKYS